MPDSSKTPPDPTDDQLLAIMHDEEREICRSGPARQRDATFEFYRKKWEADHPPEITSTPAEPPPTHTNPREFFKPNRGWFLAAAGVVAVWALYKIDAPLWIGLSTLGLLIACAAVWPWIEKSRIRQRVFWISLTLYAIGACVVGVSTGGANSQQIGGHATSPTPIPSATQLQIIEPSPSQTLKESTTPTPKRRDTNRSPRVPCSADDRLLGRC